MYANHSVPQPFPSCPSRVFLLILLLGSMFSDVARAQYAQQGNKLVGTNAVGEPFIGRSVSLSADGNTALVGGFQDNNLMGATWVFTRTAGVWSQQGGKLVGGGTVGSVVQQGCSVSLSSDGNTAIVGGNWDNSFSGAAWIFTRGAGVWSQQGNKINGTGAVGTSQQGRSVAISGDGNTVIVGGNTDDAEKGAAWVFISTNGIWSQQGAKLVGTGASNDPFPAQQGSSVALSSDGNTAIVGAYGDSSFTGAAWIYTRTAGVWSQQGNKLVGSGSSGSNVQQGLSVSLSSDGNTAMVGGVGDSGFVGAAWVFTRTIGVWTQQGGKLVGTGSEVSSPAQGYAVALSSDGNTAIVGGYADSNNAGAAWVFTRGSGLWSQMGGKLVGTGATGKSSQGGSVALSSDGRTVIVGGSFDNHYLGAVWVYTRGTSSAEELIGIVPGEFAVEQNYPNPFNPQTTITYALPGSADVRLTVFDILGRPVAELVNGRMNAGIHHVTFDGSGLSSGVYIYRVRAGDFVESRKLILLR